MYARSNSVIAHLKKEESLRQDRINSDLTQAFG